MDLFFRKITIDNRGSWDRIINMEPVPNIKGIANIKDNGIRCIVITYNTYPNYNPIIYQEYLSIDNDLYEFTRDGINKFSLSKAFVLFKTENTTKQVMPKVESKKAYDVTEILEILEATKSAEEVIEDVRNYFNK